MKNRELRAAGVEVCSRRAGSATGIENSVSTRISNALTRTEGMEIPIER